MTSGHGFPHVRSSLRRPSRCRLHQSEVQFENPVSDAQDDSLQLYRNAEFAAANISGARSIGLRSDHLLLAVEPNCHPGVRSGARIAQRVQAVPRRSGRCTPNSKLHCCCRATSSCTRPDPSRSAVAAKAPIAALGIVGDSAELQGIAREADQDLRRTLVWCRSSSVESKDDESSYPRRIWFIRASLGQGYRQSQWSTTTTYWYAFTQPDYMSVTALPCEVRRLLCV